jgi:signal transduction histidine kinase
MKNKSYRWPLVWQTLFIIVGIVATAYISRYHWKQNFISQIEGQLKHSLSILTNIQATNKIQLINVCNYALTDSNFRLTLIDDKGTVLCDSEKNPLEMDNHAKRPEIIQALNEGWGTTIRYSSTVKKDMFYGALKIKSPVKTYFIRESLPLSRMESTLLEIDKYIFIFLTPVLLFLSFISVRLWHQYEIKKEAQLGKLKLDLISNISHEVRTPLTSIKGYVQLLVNSEEKLTESSKESLSIIENNTNRLNSLFTEILDLNKIEKIKVVKNEEVDINAMIENILSNMRILYGEKNILIKKDIEVKLIHSDYNLLEHIFVNLIENAFKYNKAKGVIKISTKNLSNSIKIEINDTGNGISEDHIDRIFERFYRVDNARTSGLGGSGLGLSIVKHAVSHLEGKITVTSEIGKGSTFTLIL